MARLDDELNRLATLSPAGVRGEWQAREGEAAPDLPPSLLRRVMAHQAQEQVLGSLPMSVQRLLEQLSHNPTARPIEPTIRLKPGSRLLREWNGTLHTVQVTEDGLLFEDRCYTSLSQIAREITGAHWSGPRFFGLKKPVHPSRRGLTDG